MNLFHNYPLLPGRFLAPTSRRSSNLTLMFPYSSSDRHIQELPFPYRSNLHHVEDGGHSGGFPLQLNAGPRSRHIPGLPNEDFGKAEPVQHTGRHFNNDHVGSLPQYLPFPSPPHGSPPPLLPPHLRLCSSFEHAFRNPPPFPDDSFHDPRTHPLQLRCRQNYISNRYFHHPSNPPIDANYQIVPLDVPYPEYDHNRPPRAPFSSLEQDDHYYNKNTSQSPFPAESRLFQYQIAPSGPSVLPDLRPASAFYSMAEYSPHPDHRPQTPTFLPHLFTGPFGPSSHIFPTSLHRYCLSPEPISRSRGGSLDSTASIRPYISRETSAPLPYITSNLAIDVRNLKSWQKEQEKSDLDGFVYGRARDINDQVRKNGDIDRFDDPEQRERVVEILKSVFNTGNRKRDSYLEMLRAELQSVCGDRRELGLAAHENMLSNLPMCTSADDERKELLITDAKVWREDIRFEDEDDLFRWS